MGDLITVHITEDELLYYPFYEVQEGFSSHWPMATLSQETLDEWKRVMDDFRRMQAELRKLSGE